MLFRPRFDRRSPDRSIDSSTQRLATTLDAEDLTSAVFVNALPHLRVAASGAMVHKYLVASSPPSRSEFPLQHKGFCVRRRPQRRGLDRILAFNSGSGLLLLATR